MKTCIILTLLICLAAPSRSHSATGDANWPQFRGSGAAGFSANALLPDKWSAKENVAWKTDLPGRSWSSPIVWGDRVFLTTVVNMGESEPPKKGLYLGGERPESPKSEHHWKVLCLDLATGKVQWEKTVYRGVPKTPIHLKNTYGAETPVTDGERVYALFGNLGVFAFTLKGGEVWSKRLEPRKMRYGWGTAASPVLHGGRLFIVNDNDDQAELFALDAKTGKELWRVDRDEKSNWTTPFVWENGQRTEIITSGSRAVRSYDLDGKLLWSFSGMSNIAIPTPFAGGGLLFVSSGYVGDKLRPLYAIRPGASGDITLQLGETSNKFIAWSDRVGGPYNPSPLFYEGRLYVLYDRGLVSCYDAKTGKVLYDRERLPEGLAFTSSPWATGGRIFCLNEDGVCYVLRAGDKFELLHTNKLAEDDMCMATPALVGNRLLIRTAARLYCIRANEQVQKAAPKNPIATQVSTSFEGKVSSRTVQQGKVNWSQFRGPNGQGVAQADRIPVHFSPETNVLWKTAVPAGHSSPVIWDNHIFLTASEPDNPKELITLAIDRKEGRILWRKVVQTETPGRFHPLNNPASSTPAADDKHVYVYFGTYGLLCYDHAGNEVWQRRIDTPESKYGTATSPILYEDKVILVLDGDNGSSRLLAVHKDTGKTVWEQPRSLFNAGWSTPMIFRHGDVEELVVLGSKRLTSYNPSTGEEIWWVGGFSDETVGIPITGDGLLFAGAAALGGRGDDKLDAAGTWKITVEEFDRNHDNQIQRDEMTKGFAFIQRPELPKDNPGYGLPVKDMDTLLRIFDHDKNGIISEGEWMQTMAGFAAISQPNLVAIRPGATKDARKSHVAWEIQRGIPETPSLLYCRGRLYLMRDGGLLTCLEASIGKELFREQIGAPGQYIASPIVADDKIIVASVPGIVSVIQVADKMKVLAKNNFREKIFATPAVVENRIYLRTAGHLYALGE